MFVSFLFCPAHCLCSRLLGWISSVLRTGCCVRLCQQTHSTVAFSVTDNTITSCSREPVWSDSHFALLLFSGATWSRTVLWGDCKVWEMTLYWFALDLQLGLFCLPEAYTISLHCPSRSLRARWEIYMDYKREQASVIVSNKTLGSALHFFRLCNFSQWLHSSRRDLWEADYPPLAHWKVLMLTLKHQY